MARPVDHAQHQKMALQAFEVIRRGRFGDLTMARLAKEIGVKRSTLYWYFGNLGELFDAVIEHVLQEQGMAVAEAVDQHRHPVDKIIAWIRSVHQYHLADPKLLPNLIQLWAVSHPDQPERALTTAVARYEPLREAAIELLHQGAHDGLVAPCDSAAIIDLCSAVIDGGLVHFVGRGVSPEHMVDQFIRLVLAPLKLKGVSPNAQPSPVWSKPTPGRADAWLEED